MMKTDPDCKVFSYDEDDADDEKKKKNTKRNRQSINQNLKDALHQE